MGTSESEMRMFSRIAAYFDLVLVLVLAAIVIHIGTSVDKSTLEGLSYKNDKYPNECTFLALLSQFRVNLLMSGFGSPTLVIVIFVITVLFVLINSAILLQTTKTGTPERTAVLGIFVWIIANGVLLFFGIVLFLVLLFKLTTDSYLSVSLIVSLFILNFTRFLYIKIVERLTPKPPQSKTSDASQPNALTLDGIVIDKK